MKLSSKILKPDTPLPFKETQGATDELRSLRRLEHLRFLASPAAPAELDHRALVCAVADDANVFGPPHECCEQLMRTLVGVTATESRRPTNAGATE